MPSPGCQDLVAQMLQPNSMQRITAEQIMQHEWFLKDLPKELRVRFLDCAATKHHACMQNARQVQAHEDMVDMLCVQHLCQPYAVWL